MAWTRTDDLDGTPAQQRTFGLDGKAYVIDLSDANTAKLLKALQPYLTMAQVYGELPVVPTDPRVVGTIDSPDVSPADVRRVQDLVKPANPPVGGSGVTPPRGAKRRRRSKSVNTVPNATIRQWANENGFAVADSGRISHQVMAAYTEAHAS